MHHAASLAVAEPALPPRLQALQQLVAQLGPDAIACILTTTSCFAPRAADDVVAGGALNLATQCVADIS